LIKKKCEKSILALQTKENELDTFIKENDKEIDLDSALEGDILSSQILDLTSKDLAIEDAMFYLDKALEKKSIDLDTYLTTLREIGKEQFFQRALLKKMSLLYKKN